LHWLIEKENCSQTSSQLFLLVVPEPCSMIITIIIHSLKVSVNIIVNNQHSLLCSIPSTTMLTTDLLKEDETLNCSGTSDRFLSIYFFFTAHLPSAACPFSHTKRKPDFTENISKCRQWPSEEIFLFSHRRKWRLNVREKNRMAMLVVITRRTNRTHCHSLMEATRVDRFEVNTFKVREDSSTNNLNDSP
jgi:hypothetical protein